eukprot:5162691-Amphidinium_carterae.1
MMYPSLVAMQLSRRVCVLAWYAMLISASLALASTPVTVNKGRANATLLHWVSVNSESGIEVPEIVLQGNGIEVMHNVVPDMCESDGDSVDSLVSEEVQSSKQGISRYGLYGGTKNCYTEDGPTMTAEECGTEPQEPEQESVKAKDVQKLSMTRMVFVVEGSNQSIRNRKGKKKKAASPYYDPACSGSELDGHCDYACLARAAGVQHPSLLDVISVRYALASWYQKHGKALEVVSQACGAEASEYERAVREGLWCGLPELAVWACVHRWRLTVVDVNGQLLWQSRSAGKKDAVMQLHDEHFTLLSARRSFVSRQTFNKRLRRQRRCSYEGYIATMSRNLDLDLGYCRVYLSWFSWVRSFLPFQSKGVGKSTTEQAFRGAGKRVAEDTIEVLDPRKKTRRVRVNDETYFVCVGTSDRQLVELVAQHESVHCTQVVQVGPWQYITRAQQIERDTHACVKEAFQNSKLLRTVRKGQCIASCYAGNKATRAHGLHKRMDRETLMSLNRHFWTRAHICWNAMALIRHKNVAWHQDDANSSEALMCCTSAS